MSNNEDNCSEHKRRSSILKCRQYKESEETEVFMEKTLITKRRVSFASSNFVKPFAADENITIWDNTYEEHLAPEQSTNPSVQSSSRQSDENVICNKVDNENGAESTDYNKLNLKVAKLSFDMNHSEAAKLCANSIFVNSSELYNLSEIKNIKTRIKAFQADVGGKESRGNIPKIIIEKMDDAMDLTKNIERSILENKENLVYPNQPLQVQVLINNSKINKTFNNVEEMEFTKNIGTLLLENKQNLLIDLNDPKRQIDNATEITELEKNAQSDMEFTCQIPNFTINNLEKKTIIGEKTMEITKCIDKESDNKLNAEESISMELTENVDQLIMLNRNETPIPMTRNEDVSMKLTKNIGESSDMDLTIEKNSNDDLEFTCQNLPKTVLDGNMVESLSVPTRFKEEENHENLKIPEVLAISNKTFDEGQLMEAKKLDLLKASEVEPLSLLDEFEEVPLKRYKLNENNLVKDTLPFNYTYQVPPPIELDDVEKGQEEFNQRNNEIKKDTERTPLNKTKDTIHLKNTSSCLKVPPLWNRTYEIKYKLENKSLEEGNHSKGEESISRIPKLKEKIKKNNIICSIEAPNIDDLSEIKTPNLSTSYVKLPLISACVDDTQQLIQANSSEQSFDQKVPETSKSFIMDQMPVDDVKNSNNFSITTSNVKAEKRESLTDISECPVKLLKTDDDSLDLSKTRINLVDLSFNNHNKEIEEISNRISKLIEKVDVSLNEQPFKLDICNYDFVNNNKIIEKQQQYAEELINKIKIDKIPKFPDFELFSINKIPSDDIEKQFITLDEKIENLEKQCEECWKFKCKENENYHFTTMRGRLNIIVNFDSYSEVVSDFVYEDDNKNKSPLDVFLKETLKKKFCKKNLEAALGGKYDILSFLDYLTLTVREIRQSVRSWKDVKTGTFCGINENLRIKYGFFLENSLVGFYLEIDLSNLENINENDILISFITGKEKLNENKIKSLVHKCPKDLNFVAKFMKEVDLILNKYNLI